MIEPTMLTKLVQGNWAVTSRWPSLGVSFCRWRCNGLLRRLPRARHVPGPEPLPLFDRVWYAPNVPSASALNPHLIPPRPLFLGVPPHDLPPAQRACVLCPQSRVDILHVAAVPARQSPQPPPCRVRVLSQLMLGLHVVLCLPRGHPHFEGERALRDTVLRDPNHRNPHPALGPDVVKVVHEAKEDVIGQLPGGNGI